jgi:hypothetical protein
VGLISPDQITWQMNRWARQIRGFRQKRGLQCVVWIQGIAKEISSHCWMSFIRQAFINHALELKSWLPRSAYSMLDLEADVRSKQSSFRDLEVIS